jgi:hypothetical protein
MSHEEAPAGAVVWLEKKPDQGVVGGCFAAVYTANAQASSASESSSPFGP